MPKDNTWVGNDLMNIIFQIAQHSALYFNVESREKYFNEIREKHMEWVADQLRQCGYPTKPMGISWGILDNGIDLMYHNPQEGKNND